MAEEIPNYDDEIREPRGGAEFEVPDFGVAESDDYSDELSISTPAADEIDLRSVYGPDVFDGKLGPLARDLRDIRDLHRRSSSSLLILGLIAGRNEVMQISRQHPVSTYEDAIELFSVLWTLDPEDSMQRIQRAAAEGEPPPPVTEPRDASGRLTGRDLTS